MNKEILNAIGEFVDKNYLNNYKIEGYFGFAYLKIITQEGTELVIHYYMKDGVVEKKTLT